MKKSYLFLTALLTLIVGWVSPAWAQATVGLTMPLDDEALTVGAFTYTGTDHVAITETHGSNINVYNNQTSRKPCLDGVTYTTTGDCFRKNANGVYDDQFVGIVGTVESGYKVKFNQIDARILVADDTYTWYVEVLDGNGTQVWKSGERSTKKASTAVLSVADENVQAIELSGTFTVKLWLKQGGSTKYFVVDPLTVNLTVEEDNRATHKLTTSVVPEGAGTITPNGETDIIEGEDAILTAKANAGYKFLTWTVDGADVEGNPYTIQNMVADHEAVASFKKLPVLSWDKPEGVTCVVRHFPGVINTADEGETVALPMNYMYYLAGSTVTGFTDGTTTVAPGAEYTVTGDATLAPVFTENTKSLANNTEAATVVFDFKRGTNGNRYVNVEKNADIFITTAVVDGETIDVALPIDATTDAGIEGKNGKVNNISDEVRAQVNQGTVFTFENIRKGATITFNAVVSVAESENIAFNGVEAGVVDGNTLTFTATEDGDVKAVVLQNNFYVDNITVTYPAVESAPVVVYPFVATGGEPTDVAVDFAAQGYNNGDAVETLTVDGVTFTFDKGTNNNAPKYYTTGEAVRLYGGNSMTVTSESPMAKIALTFASGEGTNEITTDVEAYADGEWTGNANSVTFTISGTSGHRRVKSVVVTLASGEAAPVAAPTFSVAAGTYNEVQTVALAAEEGAEIYYTTDAEAVLSSESTLYTEPIVVGETTTIRAFAVKDGQGSAEVKAAYTIVLPTEVATVAELNALAKNDVFKFTGEALVVANPNGKHVYIKDETGNSLIFVAAGGVQLAAGQKIAAGWTGKADVYNGLFEAVPASELTAVEGEAVEVELEVVDASAITAENMNKVVRIEGVTYTAPESGKKNFTITVGETEVAGYNQFGIAINEPNEMATYNIVGAISVYNANVQFQPISIEMEANIAAALADMDRLEALQADLTQFIAGKEEYITPDVSQAIETILGDSWATAIQGAYEDAVENGTDYVSPDIWNTLETQIAWVKAQINGVMDGTVALYTEKGVVGDATLNGNMPFFSTAVDVEVYANKVVLKGWDGTEGSDLTIAYNKIDMNGETTLAIAGIEQTVNGEVVSEVNDETDDTYVILYPQSEAYPMVAVEVANELTGIMLGEGEEAHMGQLSLFGHFQPASSVGGEDDNMGVAEPIEAAYIVTWPGQTIINGIAWNNIKTQIAQVEEAIANYDAIVATMMYASRYEGEDVTAGVDAARAWVEATKAEYSAKAEAEELTLEDGVMGEMMEQLMNVAESLNFAAMYDVNRHGAAVMNLWIGDDDEMEGVRDALVERIEALNTPAQFALTEKVQNIDLALNTIAEAIAAYTAYNEDTHAEIVALCEQTLEDIQALVAEVEDIANYLYTAEGKVGDGTDIDNSPFAGSKVEVEVNKKYVIIRGWDGVEGSDLKVYYTSLTTLEESEETEPQLVIIGIEQTVNGEVVSEVDEIGEDEETVVRLYPQSEAYPMAAIYVANELTGIKLDEKSGQIALMGMWQPAAQVGGEDDNMGVADAVEAVYIVAWDADATPDAISNATVSTAANGAVYNLSGQKVNANFKGVVIKNGKKVNVK